MEESILWQIILQVVLIISNAIFACAEIAVISVNGAKLDQLTAQGDARAGRLKKLTDNPATFLATIQVAITLSGFLASAFAADNFSSRLVAVFVALGVPLPEKTLGTISVVIITLILSYITLIFGELVPKRVAMKKAEQLALAMSAMISFIAKLCAPLVWLLTVSTNGVLRLIGIDPKADDEEVGEEDIRLMVDAGSRSGTIDEEDKEMIQNIFEFDDLPVGEFATHRRDVAMLWMEDSAEAWKKTINETRFSNYPICDESVDNVIGVLKAKEYFRLRDKTRENVMKNAVVQPCFVPEGVRADVLFKRMKQTRDHFAIVLDEQGGIAVEVPLIQALRRQHRAIGRVVQAAQPVFFAERTIRQMKERSPWRSKQSRRNSGARSGKSTGRHFRGGSRNLFPPPWNWRTPSLRRCPPRCAARTKTPPAAAFRPSVSP